MTSDGVVSQRRRISLLLCDLAIWNQSQLDECLESVTDTKCQTIAFIQKLHDLFTDLFIAERIRKEFGTSFRFITGRKSTREHDDLCLGDRLCKFVYRITDRSCIQIAEHLCHHICSGTLKCLCAVILTVGSRKYRNKYGRLCDFIFAYIDFFCFVDAGLDILFSIYSDSREYFFQCACPCCDGVVHRKCHLIIYKGLGVIDATNDRIICTQSCFFHHSLDRIHPVCRHLSNQAAKCRCKQFCCIHTAVDGHTELVTKSHLADCCCHTLSIQSIC